MKIEDMTCDLEYAKKLKELGVKQKSFLHYHEWGRQSSNVTLYLNPKQVELMSFKISAFTTDEFLEKLPKIINTEKYVGYYLTIHNHSNCYVEYTNYTQDNEKYLHQVEDEKLSNALAKMLIWCIKNGYLEEYK